VYVRCWYYVHTGRVHLIIDTRGERHANLLRTGSVDIYMVLTGGGRRPILEGSDRQLYYSVVLASARCSLVFPVAVLKRITK